MPGTYTSLILNPEKLTLLGRNDMIEKGNMPEESEVNRGINPEANAENNAEAAWQETREIFAARNERRVHKLFQEALQVATDPESPNEKPLMTIIGLLDPKPVEEWGVSEYAKTIHHLNDIQGPQESGEVATDLKTFLQQKAAQNNIDAHDLATAIQDIAPEEEGEERSLVDFAYELLESSRGMSNQELGRRVKELVEATLVLDDTNDWFVDKLIDAINPTRGSLPTQPQQVQDPAELLAQMRQQHPQAQAQSAQQEREEAARERLYSDENEDMDLYIGDIHETLEKRMQRIMNNVANEPEEKRRQYYADLQKWVGIVLKNDQREDPDGGRLVLKTDRYDKFKDILNNDASTMTLEQMQEDVSYLASQGGGRLTHYFMQRNGAANERISALIGYQKEDGPAQLPSSLEETMDLIQAQYGSKFASGGDYELIDIRGNFHIENFYYWARERTNFLREQNPTGNIEPLSKISLRTYYSSIPLGDLLDSPQFRKQREFVIAGDENEETGDNRVIDGHWGQYADHPQLTESRSLDLLYELAFYSQDHSSAATWFQKRGEKSGFQEACGVHMSSWVSRGNWTIFAKRPSRKDGSDKEFEAYYDHNGDGTLGKSIREMVGAYANITEFTEYHTYQKGDRRLELQDGVNREVGQRKVFKDNLFYKYLESNGTNAFLLSIAESSLQKNTEVVRMYQTFLKDRVDAAEGEYRQRNLSADQQRRLEQIVARYKERIGGNRKIKIHFDESADLLDFHTQVEALVLPEDQRIGRKELTKKIKVDILTNLKGGFFEQIKEIDVVKNDPVNKRPIGTQKLGDVIGAALDGFDDSLDKFNKYIDYDDDSDAARQELHGDAFENYIKANETLAVTLAEKLTNTKRVELNYFRTAGSQFSTTEILDTALRRGIARKAFQLDQVEADYAGAWAKNMLYSFGIAGMNDTTATGFDFWTRLQKTDDYLERQEVRGYPLVEHFVKQVKYLGTNMFDMLVVRHPGQARGQQTLMDVFMGGVGADIKDRRDRDLLEDSNYEMPANAQAGILVNHIRNASDFVEKLRVGDFHFDKITKTDIHHNVVIDKKRAIEEFTKLWTNIRYTTDQHGMDFSRLISRNGKIDDVLHQQFGDSVRSLLHEMTETMYQSDPMMAYDRPGIGVFAALMGTVMAEHRGVTFEHRWTIQQLNEMEYLVGGIIQKDAKVGSRIPPHIWDAMLVLNNIGYKNIMAKEGMFSILEAIYYAALAGTSEFSKQATRPLK